MDKINIGLIRPNKLSLNNLKCCNRNKNNIKNIIDSYIELKEVNSLNNLIGPDIIINLNTNLKNMIQSYACLEEDGIIYYTFYGLLENVNQIDLDNENIIGNILSKNNECVYGNMIILKINYNNTTNINITKNDIVKLFKKRLVNTAIIICPDNSLIKHKYINNPIKNSLLKNKNCPFSNYTFLNGSIDLYFETNPENNELNTYATIIKNKLEINKSIPPLKINGYVIITFKRYYEGEIYRINIDEKLFKNMLLIITNTNEHICGINENDIYFYQVINKRISNIKNKEIIINIPDDILNMPSLNSTIHI
jgi:hypothetical protein